MSIAPHILIVFCVVCWECRRLAYLMGVTEPVRYEESKHPLIITLLTFKESQKFSLEGHEDEF